jgi:ArsR family transcriptional regulator
MNQHRRVSIQLPVLCSSVQTHEPLTAVEAAELAAAFKALGDPVRLRLLSLIAAHEGGEACVCDVAGAFELSQPTISHHLKVLREAGLVTSERRATWVYYQVVPHRIALLADVLAPGDDPTARRSHGSTASGCCAPVAAGATA